MAGPFFGGAFFGGGFFGRLPSAGGPVGGAGRQRKRRVILPDGTVVWASRSEIRGILDRLSAEYAQHEAVPIVRRQKKNEPDEIIAASPADFPAVKPQIILTKYVESPRADLDIEAMLRAYIEGSSFRKNRQEEEEWLMLFH